MKENCGKTTNSVNHLTRLLFLPFFLLLVIITSNTVLSSLCKKYLNNTYKDQVTF